MPRLKLSLSDQTFHRFGVIGHSLDRVFKFAKEAGFDGIELSETITTRLLQPKRIKAIADHFALPVTSVHQSPLRMLWSSLGSIEHVAGRASRMGAQAATIHFASVHRRATNNRFFGKIRALEERYQLSIGLENAMAQFAFFKLNALGYTHDPVRFRETIKRHNLHATYDIGHMASLVKDPATYFDTIKERLVNIHIQDYRAGFDHLSLGKGTLPIAKFLHMHAGSTR